MPIRNLLRAKRPSRWPCFWRLVVSTLLLVNGLSMVLQFQSGIVLAAMPIKALASGWGHGQGRRVQLWVQTDTGKRHGYQE